MKNKARHAYANGECKARRDDERPHGQAEDSDHELTGPIDTTSSQVQNQRTTIGQSTEQRGNGRTKKHQAKTMKAQREKFHNTTSEEKTENDCVAADQIGDDDKTLSALAKTTTAEASALMKEFPTAEKENRKATPVPPFDAGMILPADAEARPPIVTNLKRWQSGRNHTGEKALRTSTAAVKNHKENRVGKSRQNLRSQRNQVSNLKARNR